MPNLRTFYACQAVAVAPLIPTSSGTFNGNVPSGEYKYIHGVQSVGLNSSFDFENIFELGQLEIYDAVLNIPQIEITIEKVLDGYRTVFGYVASGQPLATASKHRANVKFGIYGDEQNAGYPTTGVMAGSGNLLGTITCTGMYINNVTYTFPVDGNCTESVTLVGNHKLWTSGGTSGIVIPASITNGSGIPDDEPQFDTGRLIRRQDVVYTGPGSEKAQSVTCTLSLNREDVFEFGRRIPYAKIATYPIEATTEVQSLATDESNFDTTSFTEATVEIPVQNQTITVTAGPLTVNMGAKNFLTAINHTGGDAGGGNATVTRNFTAYNTFTISDTGVL